MSKGAQYMFISIFSFSLMHLCVKAIPNIPIYQSILVRSVFSLIVCLYYIKRDKLHIWGNNKRLLILRGLVGALSLLCFFYSIQHLPLATAITISNLIPVFALILAVIFLKEKIRLVQWLFFTISFIGVYLLKGFDHRISSTHLIIAVLAALFTASAHLLVRKLKDSDAPNIIIFYFPLVTIPLISYPAFHFWVNPDSYELLILLLIAIFTHIGQIYLTKAYQLDNISGVSWIYYMGIILAFAYGYFLFEESYEWSSLAAVSVIFAGILLNAFYVSRGKLKKLRA